MTPAIALLIVRVALALVLYAFLGLVLLLLWRDLRASRPGTGRLAMPGAHLASLGEGTPTLFALHELNLLGRAADNTILVDDVTVSFHHARLAFASGQWILEDLGSRNGTRVNGIAVEGPLVITYGDDLQLGEVRFGFRAGAVPEAPTSSTAPTGE